MMAKLCRVTAVVIILGTLVQAGDLPILKKERRHKDIQSGKPAIVFLVAGQSNADGCGVLSSAIFADLELDRYKKRPLIPGTTAEEIGLPFTSDAFKHSFIWVPEVKDFQPVNPMSNLHPPRLNAPGHGIELPVVLELEKRFPENDIIIIKHALGNTSLYRHWNPESTGAKSCYRQFASSYLDAMDRLVKLYPEVRVVGLYWDQGESDGESAADEYENNLANFIEAVRRDTGIPKLKFFIRKHIFNWPNIDKIIAAQLKIVEKDPTCYVIDIDLGSFEKNLNEWSYSPKNPHLSSKAFLEVSNKLFAGPLKGATVNSFDLYGIGKTE